MATAVEQSQTLSGITDTLNKIKGALGSMSAEEKAKFDNSGVASGMKDVFSATGGVFSDLQVENGVLTSRSAQQAVNNANNVIGSAGTSGEKSPMQLLQEANNKLQKEFEKQKEVNKQLEADLSINQQKAEQSTATTTGGAVTSQPQVDPTTGEPTTAQDGTPTEASTIPGLEDDPVAQAMTQAFNERLAITNANIERLQDFVDAEDEDTQRIINSLEATAASQTKRIEKENARLAQAAQVAGIVAGRGMYSPEEHEGIISEVIQEGLDRVADIENTRDTAIIEAKKAQREFNYKAYVEMSDMVEALSDLKRQAIIDMKDRLIEIETQEREKQRFDQEQGDRNAFILAPELMDATSEEIYKAALANGIEPGLLAREVQAYKDEQRLTQLDIQGKEEDIKTQQYNRYLAGLKADSVDEGKAPDPMKESELESFASTHKWNPPYGISLDVALEIEKEYAGEPAEVKERKAREALLVSFAGPAETVVADAKSYASTLDDSKGFAGFSRGASYSTMADLREYAGVETNDELFNSPKIERIAQAVAIEAELAGKDLTAEQAFERIVEAINKEKEELEKPLDLSGLDLKKAQERMRNNPLKGEDERSDRSKLTI